MATLPADGGVPWVVDFGLARHVEREEALTLTCVRAGTLSNMAPEQAAGGGGNAVGLPADVFALVAILYEMLTGRRPFRGESPTEIERQLLTLDPETICLAGLRISAAEDRLACLPATLMEGEGRLSGRCQWQVTPHSRGPLTNPFWRSRPCDDRERHAIRSPHRAPTASPTTTPRRRIGG